MSNFRSEERSSALMITLPSEVTKDVSSDLEKEIKMWEIKKPDLHVLDFKNVIIFDRSCYRYIIDYKKGLDQVRKMIASINVSPVVRRELNMNGVGEIFNIMATLNDAYKFAGIKVEAKKAVNLDTNFINPFIKATIITFSTQMGIEITVGKPTIKKEATESSNINIAGVINLTCKHFTGTIAITFQEQVFLKVYESMLGEKHESLNDEVRDAAGEILNIIYGQAKQELNRVGYELEKAIPTILTGKGLEIHHGAGLPAIVLPFASVAGEFFLEVSVKE